MTFSEDLPGSEHHGKKVAQDASYRLAVEKLKKNRGERSFGFVVLVAIFVLVAVWYAQAWPQWQKQEPIRAMPVHHK